MSSRQQIKNALGKLTKKKRLNKEVKKTLIKYSQKADRTTTKTIKKFLKDNKINIKPFLTIERKALKNNLRLLLSSNVELSNDERRVLTIYAKKSNRTPTKNILEYIKNADIKNRFDFVSGGKDSTFDDFLIGRGRIGTSFKTTISSPELKYTLKNYFYKEVAKYANKKDKFKVYVIINSVSTNKGIFKNLVENRFFEIPDSVIIGKKDDKKNALNKLIFTDIFMWIYEIVPIMIAREAGQNAMVNSLDASLRIQLMRPKKIKKNPDFDNKFFANGKINCVLKAIREQGVKIKDSLFEKLNERFAYGVKYSDFEYLARKARCSFRIVDVNKNVKFEYVKNGRKIVELVNNEYNHVSTFKNPLFEATKNKEYIETTNINQYMNNPSAKIVKDDCLIFNDVVYHTPEWLKMNERFDAFHSQFTNNEYVSNKQADLYNFSLNSIQYPSIYINEKCSNTELVAIDKNKAFGAYRHNKLYKKFMFPSGLEGMYKVNGEKTMDIISINGISEVYNVDISRCDDGIRKYFEEINYIEDGKVYPHNYLYYLWTLGIRFNIKYCAISRTKKDVVISEDDLNLGIHKKIYGICQMNRDETSYNVYGSDETLQIIANDIEKMEGYKCFSSKCEKVEGANPLDLLNPNIEYAFEDEKDETEDFLTVFRENKCKKNLSYISSYMTGYLLIEVLDKLKKIPFKDVRKICCDSITLKNIHSCKFEYGKTSEYWKAETVKNIDLVSGNYLNSSNYEVDYSTSYDLSADKLKYSQFNLITGGAGCGKSTRFHRKFDKDERLKNCLYLFPTHDLGTDFKEKYNANFITYQKFITKNFDKNKEFRFFSYYKNLIVDECTFINTDEFQKIIDRARKYNFNVFFIGDLDSKRAYQLKPPVGEMTQLHNYIEAGCYHLHLSKVYRNGGELLRRLNLIRDNDLKNDEILELFSDRKGLPFDYKVDLENIILCPTNKEVNEYNKELFEKNDIIIQKDPKTTKTEINNKRRLVKKEDFDYTMKDLGFSITSHLSQGKTYKGKVFISPNHFYCDNLFYVMLSRACCLENIFILE